MNVQWQKNMQLIDANVILHFVLNDHPEMADKAAKVITAGAYTKPEVIAEVVYVLKNVYHTPKEKISSIIHDILSIIHIADSDCIVYAMDIYQSISLDFVDCLLIAYHKIKHENVFSFDKKLKNIWMTYPRLLCYSPDLFFDLAYQSKNRYTAVHYSLDFCMHTLDTVTGSF